MGFTVHRRPRSIGSHCGPRRRTPTPCSELLRRNGQQRRRDPRLSGPAISLRPGVGSTFYTIGVLYLVSVLLMLRVRGPTTIAQPQPDRGGSTYLRDIAVAIEFVRNSQPLSRLLVMVAIGMFSTAIFPLMPVYARDVLNVGAAGYGILGGAMGCGFIAGSLTSTALGNVMGRGTAIVVFAIIWDLSMAAFGFSRVFALSVALVFIMGLGGAVFSTLVTTLSQTCTPSSNAWPCR